MTTGPTRLALILSPERSGSTLLSVLLGAHPAVLAPPELHLLGYPDYRSWRTGYPPALVSLSVLLDSIGDPQSEEALAARFGALETPAIYRELLAQTGECRWLIDKTPAYARSEESLSRAETLQPFYIWLIRHPLAVARSHTLRRRDRRKEQNTTLGARLRYPFYLLRWKWRRLRGTWTRWEVNYWADLHRKIGERLRDLPAERIHRIHFEDLVTRPEPVLRELSERMGIDFDPGMLRPWDSLPDQLEWGVGDETVTRRRAIDPAVAWRFRETMSESVLAPEILSLMESLGVEGSP